MPTRKDILIWLVIWSQIIKNIKTREICSAQEVSSTGLIELINQTDVATSIAVHHSFVWIAVVSVWVATLLLAVKV
jgi:hypothetical protein